MTGRVQSDDGMDADEQQLFNELGERLRTAHRRVAAVDPDDDAKPELTRRLIAITDAAKHDLGRASRRLDLLLAELDERSL